MNYKIILGIAILSLSYTSCKKEVENPEIKTSFALSDTMLKSTTTAQAKMEPLKNELSFYGKITADNNKSIDVFPLVGGNVIKVNVELGDYVHKGQVLAIIRSTDIADFEKQLIDAKNDLLVAKNNLKVAQELFAGKLNAERDVLEAKSEVNKAQSQLSKIQETYKIYNIKAGSIYEVTAPISGFIIQKKINQDMLLRNDRSDNIFDIAEISEVWAMANINEIDINKIKLGIDASVTTLSYPDKIFKGKIDKIFNVIDPETKAMQARVKLQNPNYMLKPEMNANIKLSFNEDQSMIAIPNNAIIFDKSKNFVMIFKDRNNIETRQVDVYRQVGDTTYISNGLKENEKVITNNQLFIYDALND
ncbi:membrane fusion protein, cobalt-zinc-cadmium efflux system [Flavobacterium glycines]|jgi:cobalt-zinc-cadmium efflux system membrane fusion protein|uniref:Efflux transporter periplasmic adaptor subunit n=1 Tax=Flavobacterium glycines TaxID=551990 RepID=A0A1B9DZF9_9FLAO|nr:efflux RND transporter periplasmic adaptor subunit [Flavobacterium glycines]OCB75073.1 efflux transporter periplasmic adaptor subunit [Flavobacterium glycines]GEL11373.1 hemolysin D [Flavobacterium glycines]SDJ39789.1 membrane fusion protein, cobalt-zinc-cadmium efflux system [Flavobacterium glycines]